MVTKTQKKAKGEMVLDLQNLQSEFCQDWIKDSLPEQWEKIPLMYPVKNDKLKVTLSLDADMVKWFRNLGRGYQARMNAILRVYWHGILSGDIRAHWESALDSPREHNMLEAVILRQMEELRQSIEEGTAQDSAVETLEELNAALDEVYLAHGRVNGT